nr:LacI family transcriptional regulator [uncultured Prevotella sp.]
MQRKALFNTKKRPSRLEKGVPLFLVLLFQLTRYYLATLKLYDTSIPAKPYFKPN